jgi:hypothetical protein
LIPVAEDSPRPSENMCLVRRSGPNTVKNVVARLVEEPLRGQTRSFGTQGVGSQADFWDQEPAAPVASAVSQEQVWRRYPATAGAAVGPQEQVWRRHPATPGAPAGSQGQVPYQSRASAAQAVGPHGGAPRRGYATSTLAYWRGKPGPLPHCPRRCAARGSSSGGAASLAAGDGYWYGTGYW